MTSVLRRRTPEEVREYDRQRRRERWARLRRWWPWHIFRFLNRQQREARDLIKLGKRTLDKMDELLWVATDAEERALIQSHRNHRVDQMRKWERFAAGELDELELQLLHPLSHAEIARGAMIDELTHFTDSPARFAWFVKQIQPRGT
jgi:hypothetical protein